MTLTDLSGIPIPSEALDSLITSAYDALVDGSVTFGEVVTLGGVLAGKVNQFVQFSGKQKQILVMSVVERALQNVLKEKLDCVPDHERDAFRQKILAASDFVKQTLPSVLTLAVQASRGELNLGKIVGVAYPNEGPLSCLRIVLPVFHCIQRNQVETPPKLGAAVQLEMKSILDDQPSKENPDPVSEEESTSQEIRETSTVSQ